jgi:hypothetical protein
VTLPTGRTWLEQAQSDFDCAVCLQNGSCQNVQCHIVAKLQQSVEKAIKALVQAMVDTNRIRVAIEFNHQIDRYITVLTHMSGAQSSTARTLRNRMQSLFNEQERHHINDLSMLAPRRPAPGELFRKNTEYPFQLHDGSWCAPAAGIFSDADVTRFQSLAQRLLENIHKHVSAAYSVKT